MDTTERIFAAGQSIFDTITHLYAIREIEPNHPLASGDLSGESRTMQTLWSALYDVVLAALVSEDRAIDAFHGAEQFIGQPDAFALLIRAAR